MTIVEERELTLVEPPLVEPIPEELERPAPPRLEPEEKARPRVVRWLAWIAGVVFIGLVVTAISWMINGDDAVETSMTSAVIAEARTDAMYHGPAQLPGGVLPDYLVPAYTAPAQLPGGVLPDNLATTETLAYTAPAYTAPAQLPGGVLPDNLATTETPAYTAPAQLPGGVLPDNLATTPLTGYP
jgi:hypothetical protein